ncbi:MAG: hypothetical protein HC877_19900 [Thioploca sp.]|nr:hypothetical protein [Thioploca sp.]
MNSLKYFAYFPLFFIVLILYNLMASLGIDFEFTAEPLFNMGLPSGANWSPTWSGIFIMLGVITLYLELVKSTRTGTATSVEHVLSMGVFILFLLEFLLVKMAGTSTFLIITLMSLLDVVAGFSITIAASMRDFNMTGGGGN